MMTTTSQQNQPTENSYVLVDDNISVERFSVHIRSQKKSKSMDSGTKDTGARPMMTT